MRRRDDSGAVAVLVATLSVVLFGVAALAVDLGHAWATKRAVQRQVDVAALAAGPLLPAARNDLGAIATEVTSYLNANLVSGQQEVAVASLLDGERRNGEVTLLNAAGQPCTEGCVRLAVRAPAAYVAFGFAGVFGEDGADVQRAAEVQVGSVLPPRQGILPFWLPSGCSFGPAVADAAPGANQQSASSAAEATGSHTLSGSASSAAAGSSVTVRGLRVAQLPANVDRASIRFTAPDGSTFVDYAAQAVRRVDTLTVPDFVVGTEVTGTPGTWTVRALVQERGSGKTALSQSALAFTVAGTAPAPSATSDPSSAPVGCVGQQRGNFGQLTSPRAGVTGRSATLALNIAAGLDHQLVPYVAQPGAAPIKECVSPGGTIHPGALLDDISQDGRNCILADPGNDGPALLDGLVTGVGGMAGRLSEARGRTSCPGRPQLVVEGVSLNNDTLSCFLRNGATLDAIAQPTNVGPSMLDPSILDSPRLVWVPVVYATDRAQKRFQPILKFTPAFITHETQGSGPTATNGFTANGGAITSVQLFVFNELALPVDPRAPTTAYDAARASVVRLVG